MAGLVGHQKQIQLLESAIEKDHLPHSLLLVGPESIGKRKVAWKMAQDLVCEIGPLSCGKCSSCLRAIKQQSESILYIEPEGQSIKLDQSKLMLNFLSLSRMGRNRVVIINQAHLFNQQAANAILKLIEEPEQNNYFILISPEAEMMLPTIRSRSQVVRFSPLTVEQLKQIKPGLPYWTYTSSRGQVENLESLVQDQEKRLSSFALLEKFWLEKDFLLNPEWKSQVKDREDSIFMIRQWSFYVRDLIYLFLHKEDYILNADQILKMKQVMKQIELSLSDMYRFSSSLLKAEKDLIGHVDSLLLIESLWVQHARK